MMENNHTMAAGSGDELGGMWVALGCSLLRTRECQYHVNFLKGEIPTMPRCYSQQFWFTSWSGAQVFTSQSPSGVSDMQSSLRTGTPALKDVRLLEYRHLKGRSWDSNRGCHTEQCRGVCLQKLSYSDLGVVSSLFLSLHLPGQYVLSLLPHCYHMSEC